MPLQNTYKSIVTPGIALLAFVVILVLALLISGFCNPNKFDSTRTKIFISCLAGLGVFITFLFYYSVVTLQQSQQRKDIIAMTSKINKNLKHIIDEIHEASNKIPKFTLSLLPLLQHDHECNEDVTIENNMLKHKLAYKIFSLWQEIIIAVPFVDIDSESVLTSFLQRANSKELQHFWCHMKYDFNKDTQLFGDLLFKHGLLCDNNHQSYIDAAHKIHCSKAYLDIMKD